MLAIVLFGVVATTLPVSAAESGHDSGLYSGRKILEPEPLPRMRAVGNFDAGLINWVDSAMRWLGLVLAVGFLLVLPVIGRWIVVDLRRALAAPEGSGTLRKLLPLAVVLAVIGGCVARMLAPHLLSMHYLGYALAQDAASLRDIPKYGPGALALYHLLFLATGTSHVAMTFLNSVLGAILPLAGGALLVRLGATAGGVSVGTVLLALVPAFIHDSTTESLLVPATLWTVCAVGLVLRYRQGRAVADLVAGALLAVLAMFSRPESMVLVPMAVVMLGFLGPSQGQSRRWVLPVVLAVAAAALALRLLHLWIRVDLDRSLGNTSLLFDAQGYLPMVMRDILVRNLVLMPAIFPAGVTLLAAASLVLAHRRRVVLALLVLAAAWTAVSLVDLPDVSIPRVQVPAAVFVTLAAALGAQGLARLQGRWLPVFTSMVLGLAEMTAVATTLVNTIPSLWQRTSAADEEDLLSDVREALPTQSVVLIRRGYYDEPVERLHLAFPDYAFRPPFRNDIPLGPDSFRSMDSVDRPAYFVLGTRCWLRDCTAPRQMHPSCAAMFDTYRMEPVFERTFLAAGIRPDGHEMDFPWCVASKDEMKLGLYRVLGRKEEPPDPP